MIFYCATNYPFGVFLFEKDLIPEETIPLSVEEKERLYKPWATSIIIKVLGIRVGYEHLLFKPQSLSNFLRRKTHEFG